MPTVWVTSRKNKNGARRWVVHWESRANGVRSHGAKVCGPIKELADKFKQRKYEELAARELGVSPSVQSTGWAEFEAGYIDHCRKRKAPSTVAHFDVPAIKKAKSFFASRNPSNLSQGDIQAYETHLLKTYNPTTTRIWLRGLRTALNWGKSAGMVREVPKFQFPRAEPVGRVLSDSEVTALLEKVTDKSRSAVLFALYTGVRRGELLSLTWDRIRETNEGHWEAEIGGIGGPTTKTGKSRVIPLHPEAVKCLGPAGKGRVFQGLTEDISHRVGEAAQKAKLGRVRFHDLRHTWATRYMQATGDLYGLMALGGWANLGSVKVYQHLTKIRFESAKLVNYPTSHTQNIPPKTQNKPDFQSSVGKI